MRFVSYKTLLSSCWLALYRCGLGRSGRLRIAVTASLCRRAELQVVAALWTARSVVEICPFVAAVDDRSQNVVGIHNGFHEDERVVRRAEGGFQIANGLDYEGSGRGVATEYFRQVGIGPVRDVVVRLILAEITAFDRVSAVVDQEDDRLVVVSQNRREFLCRDLERAVAHEQKVTAFGRCREGTQQRSDGVADRPPID